MSDYEKERESCLNITKHSFFESHVMHDILSEKKAKVDLIPGVFLFVSMVAWMKLFYHFQLTETYPILGWVTFGSGLTIFMCIYALIKSLREDEIERIEAGLLEERKKRKHTWDRFNEVENFELFGRFKI